MEVDDEATVSVPMALLNRLLEQLATGVPTGPGMPLRPAPEPKIAEAPTFSGDRKTVLAFLTKCRMKFAGQPSRFVNEDSKILYAGSQLEGPAFGWFQPLLSAWQAADRPNPPEVLSFDAFATALTALYGDADLAATAERELRLLRQTTSVADYAAKF